MDMISVKWEVYSNLYLDINDIDDEDSDLYFDSCMFKIERRIQKCFDVTCSIWPCANRILLITFDCEREKFYKNIKRLKDFESPNGIIYTKSILIYDKKP